MHDAICPGGYSLIMSAMSYYQHRGALGELRSVTDLMSFGMSVNSLTASDFGLDLHAQLPEGNQFAMDPPERDEQAAQEFSWEMSPNTAHFQVKALDEGARLSIPVSLLRTWISSSRVGTPAFLIVHSFEKSSGKFLHSNLLTPYGLATSLQGAKRNSVTRTINYSDPRISYAFSVKGLARRALWARLDLWASYPSLMLAAEPLIPLFGDYYRGGGRREGSPPLRRNQTNLSEYDQRVIQLLGDLTHSYLTCFEPHNLNSRRRVVAILGKLAVAYEAESRTAWRTDEAVSEWGANQVDVITRSKGASLRIPPGCFSASTDGRSALSDLVALTERIGGHAPHWQDPR